MISKTQIERELRPLLKAIEGMELRIIQIQSATLRKALQADLAQAQGILYKARQELKGAIEKQGIIAGRQLVQDYEAIIAKDFEKQMSLYIKAWEAGIVKTEPIISSAVKAAADYELQRELLFLKNMMARVENYAGAQMSNFVGLGVNRVLAGETAAAVAREMAREVAENGIGLTFASGREVQDLTAYMRMQLQTAIGQNANDLQQMIFDSIDAPEKWYETSAHMGARPEHAEWQGKVFESYEEFVEATDYGEVDGLGGVNCRHTWYPFIPGVSEQMFKPYDLEENEERYEEQQEQRYIERNIRRWKREEAAFDGLGIEDNPATIKVREWQGRMREHIEDTGLTRQRAREQI